MAIKVIHMVEKCQRRKTDAPTNRRIRAMNADFLGDLRVSIDLPKWKTEGRLWAPSDPDPGQTMHILRSSDNDGSPSVLRARIAARRSACEVIL
jgi:hypothetical protein